MTRPSYVYVASSWRNPFQTAVCAALRSAGIDHYDFKNPAGGTGFSWRDVDPDQACASYTDAENVEQFSTDEAWPCRRCGYPRRDHDLPPKGTDWVSLERYIGMVNHYRATIGFESDFGAMQKADTFVLVLPCGKSAHLELGWAVGAGKRTAILLEDPVEPELMYRMADYLAPNLFDLLGWLGVEDEDETPSPNAVPCPPTEEIAINGRYLQINVPEDMTNEDAISIASEVVERMVARGGPNV